MGINKARKKEDLGNNADKVKRFTFGDLLIPLLGLFILLMLTIFVYVPMIVTGDNSYFAMRDERKEIATKVRQLESKLDNMQPVIDSNAQLSTDLRTVNQIIPNSLDVSDFTYYVDKLARENGLDFKEISSGNVSVNTSAKADINLASNVSGVSGPIVYEGNYSEIVTFLDQLQSKSPYIIETSSIFLRLVTPARPGESVEDSFWRLEINITGYYISNVSVENAAFNPYAPFTPYTRYDEILEIFNFKADLLNNPTTTEPTQLVDQPLEESE